MAQQEEGWPLGLQPLNLRVGLARNCGFFGSASFNTLLSGSPTSSTDSSSDLDTESTGSFFHDKSISLGSLMGVSSIVDLPRRSTRGRSLRRHEVSGGCKKRCSSKTWCFSLCPRDNTDADQSSLNNNNTYSSSLGHFLAVERRAAANEHRRKSYSPLIYGPDDDELALARPDSQPNSLFVNGCVAPPASSPWLGSDFQTRENRKEDGDGFGSPLFSCICGQTIL